MLELVYGRRHELEGDEHLFDGSIGYSDDEGIPPTRDHFSGLSFEQMIAKFSELANLETNRKLRLCIARAELMAPNALLSEQEEELLRRNPLAFARALTLPTSRVVLKLGASVGQSVQPIKAGYDSLADAFGDFVYVRVRPGPRVECPVCGRWRASLVDGALACTCGPLKVAGAVTPDRRWLVLATRELLESCRDVQRFYLPRAWNTSGAWVGYEDLKARYEAFTKERESCFSPKVAK